ncbi:MAG: hypothetical protein DWQ04_11915 [Chloroflexi bacterium]|nr:MAG: hypothetical protein DWQ04_11915 [Chloroflexota bacterium]
MKNTLLQTKLYIPPTRANIVQRKRLLTKLNDGVQKKLTLASATAGFGKTTLITDWLSQLDCPVAWVSLDEDDSDPQQFFNYVAAATRPFPNIQNSLSNLLQSPQPLPAKALAGALLNDLTAVSTPCLLILDDYHVIDSTDIDLALAFVLDRMPPNHHLVITSRADPGFPLSRLRARNQLTELRAQDLRFSVEETAVFLQNAMGIPLTPEQIIALEARTEGWISGLQMAALSMQNRDDVSGFIDNFTGSNRFIMDYLTDEVLRQIPPTIQDFLLQTSILTRLSAPLCTAVIGNSDNPAAQSHLNYLDRANLFLIPLDENRTWYRYHHLFADVLQKKQGNDVQERHQRASRWYEENGLITDALHHAHATADFERATHLIVTHTRELVAHGRSNIVLGWINALPEQQIRAHPLLAIGKAWDAFYSRQIDQIDIYLASAEHALEQNDYGVETENMQGEIFTIRAFVANIQGQYEQVISLCQQALQHAPVHNLFTRGMILFTLGRTLQMKGETQSAIKILSNSLKVSEQCHNLMVAMGAAHHLRELYFECGRLQEAAQLLQHILATHRQDDALPALGWIYLGLAAVAYEQNELEQSSILAQKTVNIAQGEELITMLGYISQAQTACAIRNNEKAKNLFTKAAEAIQNWPTPSAFTMLAEREVKMAIFCGDLDAAIRWQQETNIQSSTPPIYENESQLLVLARLLIAKGRLNPEVSFLGDALALLTCIEESATVSGRFGRVMEAQLLQALALDAQGDTTAATHLLEKVLTFAEAEGFIRTFVDEGEPMAALLRKMGKRPYITTLLTNFPSSPPPTKPFTSSPLHPSLLEPLSDREIEILTLIAAGKKNKEIAAELFISHNTVLYHTKNLYGKLGVNKRTQAVAKAQELGVL